jgi:hypothetical protein
MVGGWYLKSRCCFMAMTHEPLHLDKRNFVQWKIVDIPISFIWIIIFFNGPFAYAERSLRGWTNLIRPLLRKSKSMDMAGGWKLKFALYFMEKTHEPLHLDKWSFVHWRITNIPTSFIWIIIFFHGALEYGCISKLWGYAGTNAELLCVEFCDLVQCNICVSYLSFYCFIKVVLNIKDNNTTGDKILEVIQAHKCIYILNL